MAKIVISGASGDMGRRITAELLETIPPSDLTLTTRTPEALEDRAAQGVCICKADYNDPAALEAAYRGSDTLMLISSLAVTRRIPEHLNAINAAKAAGIRHIVYTSVIGLLPHSPTKSVRDHHETEKNLRASGLNWTALRNGTYSEVIPENIMLPALQSGVWHQVEGDGRFAPADCGILFPVSGKALNHGRFRRHRDRCWKRGLRHRRADRPVGGARAAAGSGR